jgi:UDP-glucose 4-epimerase
VSTVLVTGGSGFLGQILVKELLRQGHQVTNIDLVPSETVDPRLRSIVGDIRNRALLDDVLKATAHDVVFHCAALLAHGSIQPQELWSSNVDGTKTLAEGVAAANIANVVFVSSNCLWSSSFSYPVREDEPVAPAEIYGASKWEGEKILQSYSGSFATTILRSPTIIDEGRLGLLSILFEFMADGRRVWVVGDGSNRYQFIYARDLVAAMLMAWDARKATVFGIGSDNVASLRECYEYVIHESGSASRVSSLPKAPTLLAMRAAYELGLSPLGPYHYRMIASDFMFDNSRIKAELGWKPTLANHEMLLTAYRYYAANRSDIRARHVASTHRKPSSMGAIRVLKWLS